jgi:hypothetical protein
MESGTDHASSAVEMDGPLVRVNDESPGTAADQPDLEGTLRHNLTP